MPATFINVALILLGSLLGLLFRGRIPPRFSSGLTFALGLCVLGIGISNMIATADTLCVIICMVVGTLLGEVIDIEKRMEGAGELLRRRLIRGEGNSRFVEGFVNATVLFCVGAMAINGAMAAGMQGDYSILISKAVIDGVTAVTFGRRHGRRRGLLRHPHPGVRGGHDPDLRRGGPGHRPAIVTEMCAVGGTIIVGIGLNMLGLPREKLRVGNMLPAIFLPLAYVPLSSWLSGLVG